MKYTITITSKGQTTIPVAMRRKLGLKPAGGTLNISLSERGDQLIVSRPQSLTELSANVSRHIKPGTTPIMDVDEYYHAHRVPQP